MVHETFLNNYSTAVDLRKIQIFQYAIAMQFCLMCILMKLCIGCFSIRQLLLISQHTADKNVICELNVRQSFIAPL